MGMRRAVILAVTGLLATFLGSATRAARPSEDARGDCSEAASDLALAQCLGTRIADERQRVDRLYVAALAGLPDANPSDLRKSKAQLVAAQDAWKHFADENCAYVGGQEGGGNLWVTIFGELCLIDEYKKRIQFFESPPRGG